MKNYLGGLSAEHFVYCIFVLGLNRLLGSRQTVARTFCLLYICFRAKPFAGLKANGRPNILFTKCFRGCPLASILRICCMCCTETSPQLVNFGETMLQKQLARLFLHHIWQD